MHEGCVQPSGAPPPVDWAANGGDGRWQRRTFHLSALSSVVGFEGLPGLRGGGRRSGRRLRSTTPSALETSSTRASTAAPAAGAAAGSCAPAATPLGRTSWHPALPRPPGGGEPRGGSSRAEGRQRCLASAADCFRTFAARCRGDGGPTHAAAEHARAGASHQPIAGRRSRLDAWSRTRTPHFGGHAHHPHHCMQQQGSTRALHTLVLRGMAVLGDRWQ